MTATLPRAGMSLPRVGMYLLLVATLALCLFPLGWAAVTSLKTRQEVLESPYGLPAVLQWSNYAKAWQIGKFSTYTLNTVLLTVPTVLLVLILSTTIGFALSRTRIPGRGLIFLLFLLGLMVPIHGYMVPLFHNLKNLGLVDTRMGAILAMTATFLPFSVYMMRQAIDELPDALIESAVIDGARPLQVMWHIILPLTKPALLALAALQTIWAWNEFIIPLITLHTDNLRPVSVGLTFFSTRFSVDHALSAAGTIIACSPLLVIYLIFQRHFVKGILAGSIKG